MSPEEQKCRLCLVAQHGVPLLVETVTGPVVEERVMAMEQKSYLRMCGVNLT